MNRDRTFAFVFARGGSKGLPGKNLKKIKGTSLVGHSLLIANAIPKVEKTFVSSDCPDILHEATLYNAEPIVRPSQLASDNASEILAWQHAIREVQSRYGEFATFLSLPATSPLRIKSDVEKCLLSLTPLVDVVMTMTTANRNPWFNMTKLDDQGYLHLVNQGEAFIFRRQEAPQCYDLTTVAYVARPEFIINNSSLWNGRVRGVQIPAERSIDIDTAYDFEIARHFMEDMN